MGWVIRWVLAVVSGVLVLLPAAVPALRCRPDRLTLSGAARLFVAATRGADEAVVQAAPVSRARQPDTAASSRRITTSPA